MRLISRIYMTIVLLACFNTIAPASVLDILDVVAIAKGIKVTTAKKKNTTIKKKKVKVVKGVTPVAITAPYPNQVIPNPTNPSYTITCTVNTPPIIIPSGKTISSFIYSPNFEDQTEIYTELWISPNGQPVTATNPNNLALITPGTSVMGNIVKNSTTNHYDAVISAYASGSTVPLFTQLYPSVVKYTGDVAADVTTAFINDTDVWNNTWVVIGYNDGTGYSVPTGPNYGVSFLATEVITAPYPTASIYSTPLQLSAGQQLTEFHYYPVFQDGTQSDLKAGSSFLNAVNVSIVSKKSIAITANVISNGTTYDALVVAYDSSNTLTPIATQSFPAIHAYNYSAQTNPTHTDTGKPVLITYNSAVNSWLDSWVVSSVTGTVAAPGAALGGVELNNGTSAVPKYVYGYQINPPTALPVATVAPYPAKINSSVSPLSSGVTVSSFTFSPQFSDASVNYFSEMWITPANLALIPVNTDFVLAVDVFPNSSAGYDGLITAYNSSKDIIFTQSFPGILQYSSETVATTTPIGTSAMLSSYIVAYTLSDGTSSNPNPNIPLNTGFAFNVQVASPTVPYPINIYKAEKPIALNSTVSTFTFSPQFSDASANYFSEMFITPANLALIPVNTDFVLASDISKNSSGGYDGLVTAYNSAKEIIFTQSFPGILQYSSEFTATAIPISASSTFSQYVVAYTLSDGTTASPSISYNNGFSFSATVPAKTTVSITTEYEAFINDLIASGITVNPDSSTATIGDSNYPSSTVTIGNYTFFGGNNPTITGSSLSNYFEYANWTNGVIFVLLTFDSNSKAIPTGSTVAVDSVYLFLFDAVTGESLATESDEKAKIAVATGGGIASMSGIIRLGTDQGFASASYPVALTITAA